MQLRFRPGGSVDERASSCNGYNSGVLSSRNWGSDAGIDLMKGAAEAIGVRPDDGWGTESHLLFVSGGSHAGNTFDPADIVRFTPGRRVHLIPLEDVAATTTTSFAVSPPWLKQVWLDPEAEGTS